MKYIGCDWSNTIKKKSYMLNLGNSLEKCFNSQNLLYWYLLSVSANKEKIISEYYRHWPIRKFNLSVIIGIGQYEEMLIDRTQTCESSKVLLSASICTW